MHLLQSIKKRLSGEYSRTIRDLARIKADYLARYGNKGQFVRYVDEKLRFFRWKRWLGEDVLKRLGIRRPSWLLGLPSVVAQIDGYDLAKEIHIGENSVRVGDIRLPKPREGVDTMVFDAELGDIVLPFWLRRKMRNFSEEYDHLYGLLSGHWWIEGPYEIGDDVVLCPGDIVIDCGANMGLFSAVAAQNGCQVFAFEPIPIVIDNYLSVTATNYPTISICRYALWDKKEELLFKMSSQNIDVATAIAERAIGQQIDYIDFRVEATTLDDFVEQQGLERVDFIKADIEGAERNMLQGAQKVLKHFAPKLAICTYHLPDDPQVIRDIIMNANPDYRIVEKYKKLYAYVPNRKNSV